MVYEFKTPPEGNNPALGGAHGAGHANEDTKTPEILPVFKELQKSNPTIKLEGVASSEHVPSLGEWESYLRDGSMLLYFGNPSILNVLTPKIMLDVIEVANVKSYVVMDRINSRKSTIEKFEALEPHPEKVFMHEQPLQTLALLTALGSSFIMMNHLPIKPEEDIKAMESLLKCASEGNYLGRGLNAYKVR